MTIDQKTNVEVGIGSSPAFFGSSVMLRDDLRSTAWMIGWDFLVDATATVFLVRLPLPLRAAGRAVITLFRIQNPPEPWSVHDSIDRGLGLSM